MKPLKPIFFASIILSLLLLHVGSTFANYEPPLDEARDKIAEAFKAVAEAEKMGGEVSDLVAELNEALKLLEEGEVQEAVLKADVVIAEAQRVGMEGAAMRKARMLQSAVVLSFLAFSAFSVWRYGPRLFWSLWIRSKRSWKVRLRAD
ncbi:MAG: hypothetical protein FGF53_08505, partial [Candidatus Brockarchaeota archaeon]|nr:hypothetical protein [Candidatus Brockarchaeota archaeon]